MRIIRFKAKNELENFQFGILESENVYELNGNALNNPKKGNFVCKLNDIKLLHPCIPSKIICVAINFNGVEGFSNKMQEPLVFIKPNTSCANPNDDIINPFPNIPWWGEAELGVVIKNKMKNVSEEFVKDGILGFTLGNDTTVENIDNRDHHLARSKCPDSFCSFGPWIDTDFDASNCIIEAIQNGEVIRRAKTSDQFWQWPKIVSELSNWITLEPFDLILTGNPPDTVGMRYLNDGDNYIVRIEGLGELSNNFYTNK